MSDKYVAFLDILGFKEYVRKHNQDEIIDYLSSFSDVVNSEWNNLGEDVQKHINGLLVSDCIVLYSQGSSNDDLTEIINTIRNICCKGFEKEILFRCGLAKGDFDINDGNNTNGLDEKKFGGKAYVKAYQLEGASKTSAIIMDIETKCDMINYGICGDENIFEEECENVGKCYLIPWAACDFMTEDRLKKYAKMAVEAEWLPVYYNTLWLLASRKGEYARNNFKVIRDDYIADKSIDGWKHVGMLFGNSFVHDVNRDCYYIVQSLMFTEISFESATKSLIFDNVEHSIR